MANIIWLALVLMALSVHVQAKDVFAHFIVRFPPSPNSTKSTH